MIKRPRTAQPGSPPTLGRPSFRMRVLIKLGLVPVCATQLVFGPFGPGLAQNLAGLRYVVYQSRLPLMCKCAKTDCIIMQIPRHNIRLMNYSDSYPKAQSPFIFR